MASGSSRVLRKLQQSLENGQPYEAHQMYRTLYYRYANQERYSELLQLLYDGAMKLLELQQPAMGTDLAELFADTLNKSKVGITDNILWQVENLFARIPAAIDEVHQSCGTSKSGGSSVIVDRTKFLNGTLNWSKSIAEENGHKVRGHPDLHQRFASVFWHEKNYPRARYHFVLSRDGKGCATFLVEYHLSCGYQSEMDLFVAQAVLQYLCYSNKDTAYTVLTHYAHQHPAIGDGPPYAKPMLNFLWLLLLCVDLKRVQYFCTLVEQYQPSIKRDPCYSGYLDKIGQIFFGMPRAPKQEPTGFLANMLKGLMSTEDPSDADDDEDDFHSMHEESPVASPLKASTSISNGPVLHTLKEEDLD